MAHAGSSDHIAGRTPLKVLGFMTGTSLDAIKKLGVPASAAPVLAALTDTGSQSEDCLTLNVWSKPQAGDAKKAVLVWIHGGAFTTGN